MYAPAHTAIALAAKRANPSASLFGLMVAAQGSELLWVTFSYLGIEHSTVDKGGTLHLEYLPYSHSLLTGLGGGTFLWALLRWVFRRNDVATIFGWVFASHIVLDFIQHEPNLQIAPGIATPTFGLNLQSIPWLDFAIELALCVACWAYYRGSVRLLIGFIALNVINIPLMLSGDGGASPLASNPIILPTIILFTIVLAWVVVYIFRKPRQGADAAADQNYSAHDRTGVQEPKL